MQDITGERKFSEFALSLRDLRNGLVWSTKQAGNFLWSAAGAVNTVIFGKSKPQDTPQNLEKIQKPNMVTSIQGVSFFQPRNKRALLAALACSIPVAAADIVVPGFVCTLTENGTLTQGLGIYTTFSTGDAFTNLMENGYQCFLSNVTVDFNVFANQSGLLSNITNVLAQTGYSMSNTLCTWTNGYNIVSLRGGVVLDATALVTSAIDTGCLNNVTNVNSTALLDAANIIFNYYLHLDKRMTNITVIFGSLYLLAAVGGIGYGIYWGISKCRERNAAPPAQVQEQALELIQVQVQEEAQEQNQEEDNPNEAVVRLLPSPKYRHAYMSKPAFLNG